MANRTPTPCRCGCGLAAAYCVSVARTALTEAGIPTNSPAWKIQRRNERKANVKP